MQLTAPPHVLLRRPLARPISALETLLARSAAPVIAVAGTSGKSTTAGLLAAMLRADGFQVKIGLADALACAEQLTPADRVVVELMPSMVRGVPEGLAFLVLTGLAADELAPHQTMPEVLDGLRRALAGTSEGVIVNADDARALGLAFESPAPIIRASLHDRGAEATVRDGEMVVFDPAFGIERRVCRLAGTPLARSPLTTNALLAAAAASQALGSIDAIRDAARAYAAPADHGGVVSHRHRLTWISDAAANRPGRSAAGLAALPDGAVVIAGGRHGGQPLDRWAAAVAGHAAAVLLFGSGGDALADAIARAGRPAVIVRCADLEDAVAVAARVAPARATVLFSPACEPDVLGGPAPGDAFRALLSCPARRAEAA